MSDTGNLVEAGPRTLFHLSDRPDIACFEPRPALAAAQLSDPVVWAIDDGHLHNYLLPRDCPRVTFYAAPDSDPGDVARLMCGSATPYVVAIESRWLPAVRACTLYCYELPGDRFELYDAGAGYYVSRASIAPLRATPLPDLLAALLERSVELRIMPSLWPLHDAVAASSLQFSIIRMRNAAPRPDVSHVAAG